MSAEFNEVNSSNIAHSNLVQLLAYFKQIGFKRSYLETIITRALNKVFQSHDEWPAA